MKVSELMVHPVIVINEDASLEDVARLLLDHGIGGIPVVNDQGLLCGIITESDFTAKEKGVPFSTFRTPQIFGQWMGKETVEKIYETARKMEARQIMTRRVITVAENDTIEEALKKMLHHDVNRIPVVRAGVPVGIIARHDLLKLMLQKNC